MKVRYTLTAITLHWLMAAGLVGTFALGFYMADLPLSPAKLQFYSWHKWAGITLLALAVLRLCWRAVHIPPELPGAMPGWQLRASALGHGLLYVLMLATPISGWLMSSSLGFPVVWFGVLPLPDLVSKSKELADILKPLHSVLNYSMAAMVCVHVAAALKHQFIDKDSLLARMWPGRSYPRLKA
jgi:cytochrome b561